VTRPAYISVRVLKGRTMGQVVQHQSPMCSSFHSSALYSAPAASVLEALQFGTLCLQAFRTYICPAVFRRHLKTCLFQLSFQSLLPSGTSDSAFADHCARLLTYYLTGARTLANIVPHRIGRCGCGFRRCIVKGSSLISLPKPSS